MSLNAVKPMANSPPYVKSSGQRLKSAAQRTTEGQTSKNLNPRKRSPRSSRPAIYLANEGASAARAQAEESTEWAEIEQAHYQLVPAQARGEVVAGRGQGKLEASVKRKTISLNDEDDGRGDIHSDEDEDDEARSFDGSSTWSPNSQHEADEDASVRPIPPSAPPSPSPSRSSSSYLSDPRTFRSMAASTKPTTLLSIDLNGGGMAHIAQAPTNATPPQAQRLPHIRTSSTGGGPALLNTGTSITFSALPPSPSSQSRPASLQAPQSIAQQSSNGPIVHVPLHTSHHPRNNPRPSSPPLDNASVLTLASSAYAIPGLRPGIGTSAPPSAMIGGGDSVSHFGGGASMAFADAESTSHFNLGDDERLDERDVDASVRHSGRVVREGAAGKARERSVWTTNSVRTGALSMDRVEQDEENLDGQLEGDSTTPASTTPAISTELASLAGSQPPSKASHSSNEDPPPAVVTPAVVDEVAASQTKDTETSQPFPSKEH
ncbi:SHREC complex [Salix suchowensis]|nr:SHREC complex [Salix suchowensis]